MLGFSIGSHVLVGKLGLKSTVFRT